MVVADPPLLETHNGIQYVYHSFPMTTGLHCL
jgi:hypothetical protein